jgi:putative hydrolase of the HAD superfamily
MAARGVMPFRAVLFDLDGTLYHQAPVRALMAAEIAAQAITPRTPVSTRRLTRALRAFRTVREELRARGRQSASLSTLQFEEPAHRIGEPPELIASLVNEWMFRRPVKYLHASRRRRVMALLGRLRADGVRLGMLSDYPADDKLRALGLADAFALVLCTTDPDINAFKPHPRGFLRACEHWGLAPAEVAYVGDRRDVDAAGALAAGMPCYLVNAAAAAHAPQERKEGCYGSRGFEDLERVCRPIA